MLQSLEKRKKDVAEEKEILKWAETKSPEETLDLRSFILLSCIREELARHLSIIKPSSTLHKTLKLIHFSTGWRRCWQKQPPNWSGLKSTMRAIRTTSWNTRRASSTSSFRRTSGLLKKETRVLLHNVLRRNSKEKKRPEFRLLKLL